VLYPGRGRNSSPTASPASHWPPADLGSVSGKVACLRRAEEIFTSYTRVLARPSITDYLGRQPRLRLTRSPRPWQVYHRRGSNRECGDAVDSEL
jgi:hypothetical protein